MDRREVSRIESEASILCRLLAAPGFLHRDGSCHLSSARLDGFYLKYSGLLMEEGPSYPPKWCSCQSLVWPPSCTIVTPFFSLWLPVSLPFAASLVTKDHSHRTEKFLCPVASNLLSFRSFLVHPFFEKRILQPHPLWWTVSNLSAYRTPTMRFLKNLFKDLPSSRLFCQAVLHARLPKYSVENWMNDYNSFPMHKCFYRYCSLSPLYAKA